MSPCANDAAESLGQVVRFDDDRHFLDDKQDVAVFVDDFAEFFELAFRVVTWGVAAGERFLPRCLVEVFPHGLDVLEALEVVG